MSWASIFRSIGASSAGVGVALTACLMVAPGCFGADTFLTLVYHDIPAVPVHKDDIAEREFIDQLEYFRTHGYMFLSPADVLAAAQGEATLPEKGLLLTFDDAYASFYHVAYPVLQLHGIPAILSVVSSWPDDPASSPYRTKRFMNWRQIKEVADSGLVTVASHSHSLHQLIHANPAGNVEPAPSAFRYLSDRERYETEEEFRIRIRDDLTRSLESFVEKVGRKPRILTWPYGAYNSIGVEEAKRVGFELILTLNDGYSNLASLTELPRHYLEAQLDWLTVFKEALAKRLVTTTRLRGVQVDLDMIVNKESFEESDRNLGLLIERLVRLGVNTVFLQGFCDRQGTGNISSLYFKNSVLPVEADFLSHAVNRIQAREMKVFVWMPVLALELPDAILNESLKVREWKDGATAVTSSWFRRLSPFDQRSLEVSRTIFRDLAAYVPLDGILFQDDVYLAETEDFHPAALQAFRHRYGETPAPQNLRSGADRALAVRWTQFKADTLDGYVAEIVKTVKRYRPSATIARNIYSEAVTNPEAKAWFAQDLQAFLQNYDYTVVMAYAAMEDKSDRKAWYRRIFRATGGRAHGDKVVFKLQAYDWNKRQWAADGAMKEDITFLLSLGVRHVSYYPDEVFLNRPDAGTLSSILSAKDEVRHTPDPPAGVGEGFLDRLLRRLSFGNP